MNRPTYETIRDRIFSTVPAGTVRNVLVVTVENAYTGNVLGADYQDAVAALNPCELDIVDAIQWVDDAILEAGTDGLDGVSPMVRMANSLDTIADCY